MSNVLLINTSITGDQSNSRRIANDYIQKLKDANSIDIKDRDLGANPLPHLSGAELAAWASEEANELSKLSDELIGELEWANEVVLALPMYNFDSPSTLSVWIDRVVRAGKTFRYTENGPQGLLANTKVTVIATRGGKYVGTPLDTQSNYIKNIFNFIGINEVNFVYAEGLAMGDGSAEAANLAANEKIDELISKPVD